MKTEPGPFGYKAGPEELPAVQSVVQGLHDDDLLTIRAKYKVLFIMVSSIHATDTKILTIPHRVNCMMSSVRTA